MSVCIGVCKHVPKSGGKKEQLMQVCESIYEWIDVPHTHPLKVRKNQLKINRDQVQNKSSLSGSIFGRNINK